VRFGLASRGTVLHSENFSYSYNGFVCMNQVVDGLVAEYEMAATGSFKWQKLVKFLQKR
jgi:hypothetical protein